MAQKSSGSRHGTRHKFSRDPEQTLTVNDHMKQFEEDETVLIDFHPSVQEGRVHSRYHGRHATVTGFRGEAVKLEVSDGDKDKTLFIKPVHLSEVEN